MTIERAAAGASTSFSASPPLLLSIGAEFFAQGTDDARGHFLLQQLFEGAPEVDPVNRTAYSELAWDIHGQYAIDRP
jgi:hypothetical protein